MRDTAREGWDFLPPHDGRNGFGEGREAASAREEMVAGNSGAFGPQFVATAFLYPPGNAPIVAGVMFGDGAAPAETHEHLGEVLRHKAIASACAGLIMNPGCQRVQRGELVGFQFVQLHQPG